MDLQEYMIFAVPESGPALEEAEKWRKAWIAHHTMLRILMQSVEGCIGAKFEQDNGKVLGLVFERGKPLPQGWRWNSAREEYAVPNLISQKIVDMAAARRHIESLSQIPTYEPAKAVAHRVGFLTEYVFESERGTGRSTIGPVESPVQIVFVGEDGPLCYYGPDARKAHDLFLRDQLGKAHQSITCLNGADTWELPEGLKVVTQNEWDFMASSHRLELERKANGTTG